MPDYDAVIIGAGVVGLAVASRLSSEGLSVLALEKHPSFGREISSRNSEVIHAGIYYPENSLKALLCVQGNKMLYEWCAAYNIPFKNTGKHIIAVNHDEEYRLNELLEQALKNGVEKIGFDSAQNVKRKNPGVKCAEALWSQTTGVIDSHRLMESFIEISRNGNCDYAWNHEAFAIDRSNSVFNVMVKDIDGNIFTVSSKFMINAAGLYSDKVAELAGININERNLRINFCKGNYFRIASGKKYLASALVYPVPPVNYSGLGVHITVDLNGELRLGPDAVYLDDPVQDYSVPESLQYKFYESASRYITGLHIDDLTPDYAGIRPKLQGRGEPFRDFVIKEESESGLSGLINLIGIESPGLTSCLAIADYVYKRFIQ